MLLLRFLLIISPIFFVKKDSKSGLKIPKNKVKLEMIYTGRSSKT